MLIVLTILLRVLVHSSVLVQISVNTSLPLGEHLGINGSDGVMLSSLGVSFSAATTMIRVENCEAPLRQWSLLRHVRCLEWLYIEGCSDLTCSSNDDLLRCLRSLETLRVINCNSIVALPELLGDLTALEQLEVRNCKAIKNLPESIQQLTCLQRLEINRCPDLVQWCKSEENNMKLAHIKQIVRALPVYMSIIMLFICIEIVIVLKIFSFFFLNTRRFSSFIYYYMNKKKR